MKRLSGFDIKVIAIITMLIDHIAACILARYMLLHNISINLEHLSENTPIAGIYLLMRLIGRIAFPLFIFLLVQGMIYTRNRWLYEIRLAAFALISEIPFDLAFSLSDEEIKQGRLLELTYQNVFFTLAIGGAVIILTSLLEEKRKGDRFLKLEKAAVVLSFMALAALLHTDYGAIGVLAIVIMWYFRDRPSLALPLMCAALMLSDTTELMALLALPVILSYDGTRGGAVKYFFYIFYPAHLLLLWLVYRLIIIPK